MEMVNLPKAALQWVVSDDTGSSSLRIWAHMTGCERDSYFDWPHDPADLGRCLRLLEAVPDWKPRIGEMGRYGDGWARLAPRWNEVAESMESECGIRGEKARTAPNTYALMRSILHTKEPQP